MSFKEAIVFDEPIVCINCGCEPQDPDDLAALELAGWSVTEFGIECPPCSRTEQAVETQRKEDDVQPMDFAGMLAIAKVLPKDPLPLNLKNEPVTESDVAASQSLKKR